MSAPARIDEISAYDRMCWSDLTVEQRLLSGVHRRELIAYLGRAEHDALAALARAASRPRRRGAVLPHVYIVPGVMGSQLGVPRAQSIPDLLWVDPADIVHGRLLELQLGNTPVQPLGAVLYSYLGLKLRLRAAGFAVTLYDYDWRRDIDELGAQLAARLRAEPSTDIMLVAHSMGGLVARAALREPGGERVQRLLTLGTPHAGSLAAVQALRGTYPVVCRLAAIDPQHDAQSLTEQVFKCFPSLYQMLPHLDAGDALDLFDPQQWPRSGPQPQAALLQAARGFLARLAPADERLIAIVGTGQRTVSALYCRRGEFSYDVSSQGDGTVPAAFATVPPARTYYLRCEHSRLPRSAVLAQALIDLLRRGRTRRLADQWSARAGGSVRVTDAQLRRSFLSKVDWYALSAQGKRQYLNRLNQPPSLYVRSMRRS